MKYGCQAPISPPERVADAGDGRRAGFTLIEVVIAIVILGILSAAVAVNWASFIRYQELRQDAHGFHKELLALKAKALESDSTDTVKYTNNTNLCTAMVFITNPANEEEMILSKRPVNLNKKVTISSDIVNTDGLPTINNNHWDGKITIKNNPLGAFQDGRVIISNGSKKSFCIQKDSTSIKPELYYKSGDGAWTRI
jgi:prepilin-type N-terminal cleavage/methylation domain-containing protein